MAIANTVAAIERADFNTNTLTGGYDLVYDGLPQAIFMLRIVNESNRDLSISYDGTTDNDFVLANSTTQLSFQTNSRPGNKIAQLPKGTDIYVKGTAGGTGFVYIIGYYHVII